MVPANFTTTEKQFEKWSIFLDQGGCKLHPAIGAMSAALSDVPDCLPSGNPVLQVQGLRGELFMDQVTGETYQYDYDAKVISFGGIDHDMAEDDWMS